MDELRSMVPPNGVVVEEWFMDSVFFNGHMQALWNNATTRSVLLPLAHRLRSVPLAREFVNAGLLMVVQKRADD
jgi:hypothetical protein